MIPNIWLGLSNKGIGCLLDEIWYKCTVSGIELDSDPCKKSGSFLCGYKKNIFSITIIIVVALSERENVETYLSIVNEKLLLRPYGMTLVSLQYNHPWQIRHECNDRYVFNNKDSSRSFKLILFVYIARKFFSFSAMKNNVVPKPKLLKICFKLFV